MSDQKKPETIADEELEQAQGGLYSTSGAGTELYSADAGTMEVKRRKRSGDGFIGFGAETEI